MAAPTIVAAFEPFDGRPRNRSWEAVRRLPAAADLQVRQLPVDFARLPAAVGELLGTQPAALLLVGEAGRRLVTVEQVALNIADRDRPDNAGAVLRGRALVDDPGAPLALRASWDARAVARTLCEQAIPAEASFHAGTFACNASLYLALRAAGGRAPAVGFLHLPVARWPIGPRLGTLTRAVEIAARALAAQASVPSAR